MFQSKKGSLLRKGIAAFLLFMMLGSGLAFAAEDTEIIEEEQTAETIQVEESTAEAPEEEPAEAEELVINEDENAAEVTEPLEVEVKAAGKSSAEGVEEIKEEEQLMLFAQNSETSSRTVRIRYNKRVNYENFRTHDFYVVIDGKNVVAYCIEPTAKLGKTKTFTAKPCSSALLSKALYYSYGNPGYDARSAAYLNGLNLKSCYRSDTGRYAFCHVMLSYIYDGESDKDDAFKGCSSNTKTNVKKFVAAIKSWPDPPTKSQLGFSALSFKATWNEKTDMQETPVISVSGTKGNSINLPVPANVTVVKGSQAITKGTVKMTVGDSFKLRAPKTVRGQYTSPAMITSIKDFQPYIIVLSGKQDQMFGISSTSTASYSVRWMDFGRVELIKTSSDEEITKDNTYYSLEGARYGLYSKASGKKYAELVTDENGKASVENIPYGKYYLKEIKESRGYELDVASHDITVASPAQSETLLEKPIVPDITTNASVSETGESSAEEGGTINISDTVEYSGVEPGLEYSIVGRLMDKTTGDELAGTVSEVVFTPEESSGVLDMDYHVDGSGLGGNTLVAFERLYQNGNLIATHEDINNEAQSVEIRKPEEPTTEAPPDRDSDTPPDKGSDRPAAEDSGTPPDKAPDTGDGMNLLILAFALAVSGLLGLATIMKKN